MGAKDTGKWKVIRWISVVYVLSFLCYVPVLLDRRGIVIPRGLLLFKYLFVCIPAIAAICQLAVEHNLKTGFVQMFSGKIALKHILAWAIAAAVGVLISYCYSLVTRTDIFQNTYSSVPTLLAGGIYLFITAFVEEIAWRGFLLERVSAKKGICSILFAGMIWAVWHMPMWIIRNSLDLEQIIFLCIWTILVSVILGITYYQCRNILLAALLHASFNLCWLAPMQYNIAALTIAAAIAAFLAKSRREE